MRLLVVDDEESIRRVVGDFLTDCGHQVVTAEQGVEALLRLEGGDAIDAIVSDVRMPRMDGLALLRTVRVRHPEIPVVLMTGHGDESVAAAALQHGAQDYLQKPVGLLDLVACIDRLDDRRRLESQILGDDTSPRRGKGEPSAAAPRDDAPAGVDILVVAAAAALGPLDDALRRLGHSVHRAATALQARQAFRERPVEVAIVEVRLADADGIDLVAQLRVLDPTVVHLVTAAGIDQQTLLRAMEVGAAGFLPQPPTEPELRRLVGRALAERRRQTDMRLLLGDLIEVRSDLQAKVVERERYLGHLIESAPFGIVSTDRNGAILTFNGTAQRIHGYSEKEVRGRFLTELFGSDADRRGLDSGGESPVHREHRRKDGTLVPVLVHGSDVLDGRGQRIARLYVVEDRTEREHMESQLLQAERLSVVGQLAPRVAHEFKTPLQAILAHAQLAGMCLDDGEAAGVRDHLAEIVPAVRQMSQLVQQMLDLGRPRHFRVETVQLAAELERVLALLEPVRLLQNCKTRVDCVEPVPPIRADAAQIEQALRNLIVNAVQAMERAPTRELTLGLRGSDDGTQAILTVRDTGCGIDAPTLARIFQPFFTTKPEGKGTGLGLPIVKTILDRYGADVQVDSEPGLGTTFTIRFPAATAPPPAAAGRGT